MSREQALKELSGLILEVKQSCPLRVGIDGIDAAGKTFLANELVPYLVESGCDVVRASIDGFHNPKHIRHQRGHYSPEGYYCDSFNYELLKLLLSHVVARRMLSPPTLAPRCALCSAGEQSPLKRHMLFDWIYPLNGRLLHSLGNARSHIVPNLLRERHSFGRWVSSYLLKEYLLKPLGPGGNRKYRLTAFDFKTDRETRVEELQASDTHVLLFEGVFLFRPELYQYWDFKIFIDIDFQTSLDRALERDIHLFGDKKEILKRYQERYIPGQQIYLESVQPKSKADIVFDNNDFTRPKIIFQEE